jgi:hypothetical protein
VASEEKLFQKSTNKKQELSMMAMFVNGSPMEGSVLSFIKAE